MEPFTVTTLITKKDYRNFFYGALYRKPYTVIVTLLGISIILVAYLEFSGRFYYMGLPWLDLGLGLFLILTPTLTVVMAVKRFASSPDLCNNISYTFGEDNIITRARTCDATLTWEHIIKVKETKQLLLLFSAKKAAYFIKKDQLTSAQIAFIKSKSGKK